MFIVKTKQKEESITDPQINVPTYFLFLNQNICCGYPKELSQWYGSVEQQKHMFRLLGKKIVAILRWKFLLNWTYAIST